MIVPKPLVEEVNSLPIRDVIEKLSDAKIIGFYGNMKCLSPLRDDNTLGSFTLSSVLNVFRDWTTGKYGGPINFAMEYWHLGFPEATVKLAKEFGISYDEKLEACIVPTNVKTVKTTVREKRTLDIDSMDKVYNIFLDMLSLQEDDLTYLLQRDLKLSEIVECKLKTAPLRRTVAFREEFEKKIIESLGSTDILFDVPGFYKKKGEPFSFSFCGNGILIPTTDIYGKINALQVRNKVLKENQNRYQWFSAASYALMEKGYEKDSLSPGSPVHFVHGTPNSKAFMITEGFFKARALRKTFGRPTWSVQGVGNWKAIIHDVDAVKQQYSDIKKGVIVYDSDMCYNIGVVTQAMNLGLELKEHFDMSVLIWNVDFGKGIDDFLEKGNDTSKLVSIPIDLFEARTLEFKKQVEMLDKEDQKNKPKIKQIFESIFVEIV